jgi:hypothetical protein
MPRNLRLRDADNFNEVTDTDFLPCHQVDEPQARGVSKRTEKPFKWELPFHVRSLAQHMRLDECVVDLYRKRIRKCEYDFHPWRHHNDDEERNRLESASSYQRPQC